MSTVEVQSVAQVHLRTVRYHQIKKRHHIRLLLSKVFTDLEKVLSLKWRCQPWEAFHWWRGEHSTGPAVRLIVECSIGVVYTVHGILPFPSPGDLHNPGIEPSSPALQADSSPAEPPGKPKNTGVGSLSLLQQILHLQESNWSLLHCRWILYQLNY